MKNLLIITCAMLLTFFTANAADNYKIGDTLYVWAPSGLNVRTGPSTQDDKMGKLEMGDYVVVKNVTGRKYITNALSAGAIDGDPYQLVGQWIEVENDKYYGYLVDIYLLKFPYRDNLYDSLSESNKGEVSIDTLSSWSNGSGSLSYTLQYSFKDGSVYNTCSEGYFESNALILPNSTIEEAYIFINQYYQMERKYPNGSEVWKAWGTYTDRLEIGDQGSCSLYIETKENKQYISMQCACC